MGSKLVTSFIVSKLNRIHIRTLTSLIHKNILSKPL